MPMLILFQKEHGDFPTPEAIAAEVVAFTGLECKPLPADDEPAARGDAPAEEGIAFNLRLELPELTDEDGEPLIRIEANHRLDRDEDIQQFIDEVLEQDEDLRPIMEQNHRDIFVQFEDTPASEETAFATALAIAKILGIGILVPPFEEDDDTAWFPTAEDFYEVAYAEGDEDDDEDYEDEEEDEDDDEDKAPKRS
jgi:hypothetical protein